MMGMIGIFIWNLLQQILFHRIWRLSGGQAQAVRQAKHMRINRQGWLTKGDIQDNIGRFASDTGQGLQRLSRSWNLPRMIGDQFLGQGQHILGLGIKQANGFDTVLDPIKAERNHRRRRIRLLKQYPRGLVHPGICGLRRQDNRHQ